MTYFRRNRERYVALQFTRKKTLNDMLVGIIFELVGARFIYLIDTNLIKNFNFSIRV